MQVSVYKGSEGNKLYQELHESPLTLYSHKESEYILSMSWKLVSLNSSVTD